MTRIIPVVAAVTLLASGMAAQQVTYEGGLSGSTGRYFFAERTNSFALGTGLQLGAGRWSFRATLPVWLQNTTLVTTSGVGPVPTGGSAGRVAVRDSGQAREQRRQAGGGGGGGGTGGPGGSGNGAGGGNVRAVMTEVADDAVPVPGDALTGYRVSLADPLVGGSVRLLEGGRLSLTIGATVKVPVADTADLGTGQWDTGANMSLSVLVGRRWTVGLDAAYWRLGDLDSLDLRDPVFGSLSVGVLLNDRWAALASIAGGSTMLTGFDPPLTATAMISRVSQGIRWGASLGVGLSESSPDISLGVTWAVPLAKRRP